MLNLLYINYVFAVPQNLNSLVKTVILLENGIFDKSLKLCSKNSWINIKKLWCFIIKPSLNNLELVTRFYF